MIGAKDAASWWAGKTKKTLMAIAFTPRVAPAILAAFTLVGCAHAPHPSLGASVAPASTAPPSSAAIERMIRGVQAARDGARDRALALLREALTLDPQLWQARYDTGLVLAVTGDLAAAERELLAAAKAADASDSPDVAVALAEVRRRRGEHKLAAESLGDYVQAHPGAVAARTLYVATLRESGQVDRAIAEAREVLVRKPADAAALAELSLSHLAKGERETAALLAKQAVDASPNSAVAHRATGLVDLADGDDAAAFDEFRKAAQADPRDTTSRLNMGVVLLRAGAYAKAEEQYHEILRLSPEDADAQVGLAAALRGSADAQHSQRLEEARAVLDRLLASDPHQTSALFNLGVLYADFLKKPSLAAPLFKRFLAEAPPDHPMRAQAEKYLMSASVAPAPATPSGAPVRSDGASDSALPAGETERGPTPAASAASGTNAAARPPEGPVRPHSKPATVKK